MATTPTGACALSAEPDIARRSSAREAAWRRPHVDQPGQGHRGEVEGDSPQLIETRPGQFRAGIYSGIRAIQRERDAAMDGTLAAAELERLRKDFSANPAYRLAQNA